MEVSGQLHAPAALVQRKKPAPPTGQEAGSAPQPVWTLRRRQAFLAPPGNRTPAVQPLPTLTELSRIHKTILAHGLQI
jgi:hypothetical protein